MSEVVITLKTAKALALRAAAFLVRDARVID